MAIKKCHTVRMQHKPLGEGFIVSKIYLLIVIGLWEVIGQRLGQEGGLV